jgi:hypothetical protein
MTTVHESAKNKRDLELLLAFDSHVASMVTGIGYGPDPVFFTVGIANEAAELVHYGHQSPTAIQKWAYALLQRRDVLFETGWSVPLLDILERYSFGGNVQDDAASWRRSVPSLQPQLEADREFEETRLALLELAVDLGDGAEGAIAKLRAVGQEGITRPILFPATGEFARTIQNTIDGFHSLDSLRGWAIFLLGRRDIGFRSDFESQQIIWILLDCVNIFEASNPMDWLDAATLQLARVKLASDSDAADHV